MNARALIEFLHAGQKRKTGDPYVSHPCAVRDILMMVGIEDKSILDAALLHDVIEDSSISKEYLKFRFGDKITNIVELVSKKPVWRTSYCKMKSKLDTMESLWLEYPEAIVIKMADRLHNLQTIHGLPYKKQKKKIKETKELLLPLFTKIAKQEHFGYLVVPIKKLLKKLTKEILSIEQNISF